MTTTNPAATDPDAEFVAQDRADVAALLGELERVQAEAAALREALHVLTVCDHGGGLDCPDCEPVPPVVRQALAGTSGRKVAAVLAAARELAELARFHADEHGPYPLPGLCAALADYDRVVRVMAAATPKAGSS